MKKIVLGSLFCTFACTQALALSEIEISGELDVTASVWTLPTGERGNSAFNVPSMFMDINVPLPESAGTRPLMFPLCSWISMCR
ncbi:hypothetical protein EZJ49_03035 [Bdellovibrio bacteriovorus]|uniref:hypothetical protein n=1 Tax=Bdellovibrio bacteriovorus TaxID=959 RepID=UPI0021CF9089|nr:hypothetical protein [Bdellovibrio bacteriovorus]UXR65223.1 hypothetical protein EZJ49_03035 [Bdellovibrio bacteriovorus]